MMTSECCNDIVLEGKVLAAPAPSHENHGVRFFRFFLEVPRLSGQAVLIPEPMVQQVCQGETVRVRGQLRSFNNRSGVGSRLVLTVYGQEVLPPCGEAANHIALTGSLCKAPIYRRTPLGRTICDLMLAGPPRAGRTGDSWPSRCDPCPPGHGSAWRDGSKAASIRRSQNPARRSG